MVCKIRTLPSFDGRGFTQQYIFERSNNTEDNVMPSQGYIIFIQRTLFLFTATNLDNQFVIAMPQRMLFAKISDPVVS